MDFRSHTPGSSSMPPPPHRSQDAQNTSSSILPSREVHSTSSQVLNTFSSSPSHNDHRLDWNGASAKPEAAVNKHIDSPQLTGLRAPPPTPEARAQKMPPTGSLYANRLGDDPLEEELSKDYLLISHLEKHLSNKAAHTGLGESMYAPRRSSHLANEDGYTRSQSSGRDVSPASRREQENTFERLSFVVASASKAELLSKINAESMAKSNDFDLRLARASLETSKEKKEVALLPSQSRVTTPDPVHNQTPKAKQAQMKTEKMAFTPAPSHGLNQSVKVKQANAKFEMVPTVSESILVPHQPAKDERAYVRSEKISAVLPTSPMPGQPAKDKRLHGNPKKVAAEPPIVAFKVGLQSFLDKYGARNNAATPKLGPAPLEKIPVPLATGINIPEPRHPSAQAEKADADTETTKTPSRTKWVSAIAPHLIHSQQPKPVIKPTPAVNDELSLPPDPKVIYKVPDDTKISQSLTNKVEAHRLRPSTPLRAIAVSQRDVPSTGKDKIPRAPSSPLGTITTTPVKFEKLSPQTARHVLKPNPQNSPAYDSQNTDDTYTTYWGRYPPPERRDKPVARVRRAIISGLPIPTSTRFVASLVYGGLVENIVMKPGGTAEVLFVNPDECSRFCDDNKNGLVYGKEVFEKDRMRELFVLVKAHQDVDVVGGKMGELILQGVTRCVRIVWADADYTTHDLWKLAEGNTRKVEHIVDENREVEIDNNGKKTSEEVRSPRFGRWFSLCAVTETECSVESSLSAFARCRTQTAFAPHFEKIWIGSTVTLVSPLTRVPQPQVSISMTELFVDDDFEVFNLKGRNHVWEAFSLL
ncbi:hypothetical protein MMC11_002306 [Xylographa trunciseda]|nr:hypothetical protein [Xylographa trunciseda]